MAGQQAIPGERMRVVLNESPTGSCMSPGSPVGIFGIANARVAAAAVTCSWQGRNQDRMAFDVDKEGASSGA
jgi:hypothetical protein